MRNLSGRIERLETLAARGATLGERRAALRALDRLRSKAQREPRVTLTEHSPTSYTLAVEGKADILIQRAANRVWEARIKGRLVRVSLRKRKIFRAFGLDIASVDCYV